MIEQERAENRDDNSFTILALIAVFVLVLGTVMLFTQDDRPESPGAAEARAQKDSETAERSEFELRAEKGSVGFESEA